MHSVAITMLDKPTVDEWGVLTIGRWGGYLVQIHPMIFNDRLVLAPEHIAHLVYDFGWCYPKGPALILAALAWDPATEGEPAGFIRRIGHPRVPGETPNQRGSHA